jgi:hypothetical protein
MKKVIIFIGILFSTNGLFAQGPQLHNDSMNYSVPIQYNGNYGSLFNIWSIPSIHWIDSVLGNYAPISGSNNYIQNGTSPVNQNFNLGTGEGILNTLSVGAGGAAFAYGGTQTFRNAQNSGNAASIGVGAGNIFDVGSTVAINDSTSTTILIGAVAVSDWNNIFSGTSSTIPTGYTNTAINPSSVIASYTLTLPPFPVDGQIEDIYVGGQIPNGNAVVTSMTVSPNGGQTLVQYSIPTILYSGDHLSYIYNLSTVTWYRRQP